MKAVRVGEPGVAAVADVAEPRLRDPRDAIVRVTAAAICGADLFPLHGMTPGFDPATVLGHEFAGVVTEVGDAVDLIEAGQRVVSSSMTSDGTCTHCRMGRPAQCASRSLFGYSGVYPRLDGGQAGSSRRRSGPWRSLRARPRSWCWPAPAGSARTWSSRRRARRARWTRRWN